ncbi:MAG: DoxX family protein [Dysgonamonadaceae bacterium]|jgi:uncharacterized membrane protein YphA (DoxX/SURF4 family)|nr:DoxX family protein [Dysgonamonadaceae bacterium]
MKSAGALMKIGVEISRIIVGAVFVFSGFVKMVDPLGFTYKSQDYLIEWGLQLFFPLALPVALALSMAEFLLGVFILLGIYRRWATLLVFVLMLFMTPFTLWIAIENPVKDCGCFGDALIISNWETFYKNIVLVVLSALLCFKWKELSPLFPDGFQWAPAVFSVAFALLFSLNGVFRMQVFDFRPYKIGASISEQMRVDPANADVYRNTFIYEKDGKKQEFTEDNYPWNDSTWTFVDMKTELLKEGEKPKIEDFQIIRLSRDSVSGQYVEDEDIMQDILSDSGYTFLMTSYSLGEADKSVAKSLNRVADFAQEQGIAFYCLTSSVFDDISKWAGETAAEYTFCNADERVLKTINRSNPGLMLLKNGIVIDKWDRFSIPGDKKLGKRLSRQGESPKPNNTSRLLLIMAIFILPLGVLNRLGRKRTKNNNLDIKNI